jgi:hypothetical protein
LRVKVDAGMTVVRGAVADVTPTVLLEPITQATAMGTFWIQNRGARGYINGEILLAHPNNEDYEGAQIFLESQLWRQVLQRAEEIVPEVENWDRGFINVRPPGEGEHPPHADTRLSTLIMSFRFNYRGVGPAGSIVYLRPGTPSSIEINLWHGDVAVYTDALHHTAKAGGVLHQVPANTSEDTPYVTIMLETRDPVPADVIDRINERAPSLARPPHEEVTPSEMLPHLVVPKKQIDKGSFQRFTQADREKGVWIRGASIKRGQEQEAREQATRYGATIAEDGTISFEEISKIKLPHKTLLGLFLSKARSAAGES